MSHLLPDYYEALASAIERLPRNDRAARGALYDRARRLLMEEAQKADPPWQLMEIVREQRALEEAVLKAEANFATQVAAPSRPRAPAPMKPRKPQPAQDEYYEEGVQHEPERRAPAYDEEERAARSAPARLPQRVPRRQNGGKSARAPEARANYPLWVWAIVGVLTLLVLILLVLLLRPGDAPVAPPPAPAKIESKSPLLSEDTKARADERSQRQRDLIARGNEASRSQDYAGAIANYSEAIALGPVDAAVYNNRAFAYWSRGMTDEAIADYDQAIKREPENIVALTNRAVAYNFRGDYDSAIRDLDRALALKPDSPDVLNSRCWGRTLAGHLQAAVADCNEALRLRPDDPNTLDSRGFAYLKMGETDRAIADYTAALKLDPKLAGALYGRGVARVRKGDKKGGEADVAAAKAMRPEIDAIFARYGIR